MIPVYHRQPALNSSTLREGECWTELLLFNCFPLSKPIPGVLSHGPGINRCRAICAHTCTGIHSAHKGRPPFHPLLLRMECTDHAVPRECAPAALLLDLAPAWPRLQHACLPCMRRMHMCTNAIDVHTCAGKHTCACICTRAINITRVRACVCMHSRV